MVNCKEGHPILQNKGVCSQGHPAASEQPAANGPTANGAIPLELTQNDLILNSTPENRL